MQEARAGGGDGDNNKEHKNEGGGGKGARTEEKNLIGGRVFFFLPRPSTGLSGGYNA